MKAKLLSTLTLSTLFFTLIFSLVACDSRDERKLEGTWIHDGNTAENTWIIELKDGGSFAETKIKVVDSSVDTTTDAGTWKVEDGKIKFKYNGDGETDTATFDLDGDKLSVTFVQTYKFTREKTS